MGEWWKEGKLLYVSYNKFFPLSVRYTWQLKTQENPTASYIAHGSFTKFINDTFITDNYFIKNSLVFSLEAPLIKKL